MPAPHQRDDHGDDVDPTGIRDLLAGLPDPGPMPKDLVRRIEARLALERAHRVSTGGSPSGMPSEAGAASAVARADTVVDLAAERSHRRPVRTVAVLGAAAAGLLATTVAVTQLVGLSGGTGSADTAASYPSLTRGEQSADAAREDEGASAEAGEGFAAAAPDEADAEDDAGAQEDGADSMSGGEGADTAGGAVAGELGPTSLAEDPVLGGRLLVLPHLGPAAPEELGDALLRALDDDDVRHDTQDLTLAQARSCWQGLAADHPFDGHVAARARVVPDSGGGYPAVVLLGLFGDDLTGQVWIMPAGCTGDAGEAPISGPYPLDQRQP